MANSITAFKHSASLGKKLKAAFTKKGADYEARTQHFLDDNKPKYINRLILESSPYLLQHAHNPVDWYPWGDEAFSTAKKENKPVFLSIGYSTCHWCHVMEHESFESEEIAKYLNEEFICIKVDREQRPDIDDIYMSAVQIMTGHGGWPMSSFLTTDGKPFFAGTYFPPANFLNLLQQVILNWQQNHDQLVEQANKIAEVLQKDQTIKGEAAAVNDELIEKAVKQIEQRFVEEATEQRPLFPNEPELSLLVDFAIRKQNPLALQSLINRLELMQRGGIYDQVGGGFHRYSVDTQWLVPHFEKMLYNQAQLGRIYAHAWSITHAEDFKRTATQTFDYVLREMQYPKGGFYSATDADSEGEEGTFFLWTPQELEKICSTEDLQFLIDFFDVTEQGNFEGKTILNQPRSVSYFAHLNNLKTEDVYQQIDRIREQLWKVREKRIKPIRDDKLIAAWNGMMITGLIEASIIFDREDYKKAATKAADYLWQQLWKDNKLFRVVLDGEVSITATQEDYAYFTESCIALFDVTQDVNWLQRAETLCEQMLELFYDHDNGGFRIATIKNDPLLIAEPKATWDGAIPSGNSVALRVLALLSKRTDNIEYPKLARQTIAGNAEGIQNMPSAVSYFLTGAAILKNGELSAIQYAGHGNIHLQASVKKQQLELKIDIKDGWHINGSKTKDEALVATQITLPDNSQWQLKEITYPDGDSYEKQITITAKLKQPDNYYQLPLQISLQPCNDEICLAAEKLTLYITTH